MPSAANALDGMHVLDLTIHPTSLACFDEPVYVLGMQTPGVDRDRAGDEFAPRRMFEGPLQELVQFKPGRRKLRAPMHLVQRDQPGLLSCPPANHGKLQAIALDVDRGREYPDPGRHFRA